MTSARTRIDWYKDATRNLRVKSADRAMRGVLDAHQREMAEGMSQEEKLLALDELDAEGRPEAEAGP